MGLPVANRQAHSSNGVGRSDVREYTIDRAIFHDANMKIMAKYSEHALKFGSYERCSVAVRYLESQT